jgi:hypothetical protein
MFKIAVDYVLSIQDKLPDNTIFYCEYLKTPKHNTIAYSRTPKNNLILFGVCDQSEAFKIDIDEYAELLGIERVPIILKGKIADANQLVQMLEIDSILGNSKIEGVVVKNYSKTVLIDGQVMPIMSGKFVSDVFKERNGVNWKENSHGNKWEIYKQSFCTEARWLKAIQHLRDAGKLYNEPKDIGNITKEIQKDIIEEEKENIKEFLWNEFNEELLRKAKCGMPAWYKKYLLEQSFEIENRI